MTLEHFRPFLDEVRAVQQLFKLCENLARGQVPVAVVNMVRCGRMTAFAKPDGGVRGIAWWLGRWPSSCHPRCRRPQHHTSTPSPPLRVVSASRTPSKASVS